MQFPVGGPLKPSLYLASLLRYCVKHLAKHIPIEIAFPIFLFKSKIGGYSILHLCVCSRSLSTSGGSRGPFRRCPQSARAAMAPIQLLSNCLTTKTQQHKNTIRKKCIRCGQLTLRKMRKIVPPDVRFYD